MLELTIAILGITASAFYIGYLAFAIGSVPLWTIAIATFALMIREFVLEFRQNANRKNQD